MSGGTGPPRPVARQFARAVVALRLPIVAVWIGGAIAATLFLPSLEEAGNAPLGGLIPSDASAIEARERSLELFDFPLLAETAVVERDPDGLTAAEQQRVGEQAVSTTEQGRESGTGILLALPLVNDGRVVPGAREQGTTAITWLSFDPELGLGDQLDRAREYADATGARPDHFVGVTGPVPARLAEFEEINAALPTVELATVALIALVLGLMFRSIGAPLVALLTAGLAYLVSVRLIAWVGMTLDVAVPQEVEPLVVVLLLGVVTDYSIFFLTGLRTRLREGASRTEAARDATSRYLPIVLTAGLIVAAGAAALPAGTLEFFRAFGPGLALTALVGLAVSVTLLPALMAIFGRGLLWPSRQPAVPIPPADQPSRLARLWTSRPLAAVIVLSSVALLLAAASGLRHLELGFSLIGGLPADAEPRQTAIEAGRGFTAGIVSPTEIVLEGGELASKAGELGRLEAELERQSGVAAVVGPREAPDVVEPGAVISERGDAARLAVVFADPPLGGDAIDDLDTMRASLPGLLDRAGLPDTTFAIAGDTALASETVETTMSDVERIALAALGVNLAFLLLFLRSLVAPLLLLAASILALAATLGLTSLLFVELLGHDEVTYYVPFAAAVLLVSLGSDYNVYVVGQIADEARLRPAGEAVALAVPRASRAISVAGLALAGSFALLALVPLRVFRELAFALSVGVLVDAFVVRSLLVPALITLWGDLSWWPRRLRRPLAPTA